MVFSCKIVFNYYKTDKNGSFFNLTQYDTFFFSCIFVCLSINNKNNCIIDTNSYNNSLCITFNHYIFFLIVLFTQHN